MDETLIKRILPHSVEAERAVVGSMLMDTDAIITAGEMITGDDFYQKQYGILFDTIVEMNNRNVPVDLVTLQEDLKTKDLPEETFQCGISWRAFGQRAYVGQCTPLRPGGGG